MAMMSTRVAIVEHLLLFRFIGGERR